MKAKIYGNERTHLTLTDEAQRIYSDSDPLTIKEYESDNGYIYSLSGIIEADGLTAEEVSDQIESLDALCRMSDTEYYDKVRDYASVIGSLAEGWTAEEVLADMEDCIGRGGDGFLETLTSGQLGAFARAVYRELEDQE